VPSLLFGCFWNKRERSYSAVSSWLAAAMQIESSPFDANIRKLFRPTSDVERASQKLCSAGELAIACSQTEFAERPLLAGKSGRSRKDQRPKSAMNSPAMSQAAS
jgi:hypothetical protein